jgi:hypothetical protein
MRRFDLITHSSVLAFECTEVMKAIACGVAVGLAGGRDATGDHPLGLVLIVSACLLRVLAVDTNRLMIVY